MVVFVPQHFNQLFFALYWGLDIFMNDSFIIETYPNKLHLLAISIFLLGIYSFLTQGFSDLFAGFICFFSGGVLYCSLERKSAKFSNKDSMLEVSSHSVFSKSNSQIKLNNIIKIEVVKGLGSTGGFWFIEVLTSDESYSISSHGAMSKKSLDLELIKINRHLGGNTYEINLNITKTDG